MKSMCFLSICRAESARNIRARGQPSGAAGIQMADKIADPVTETPGQVTSMAAETPVTAEVRVQMEAPGMAEIQDPEITEVRVRTAVPIIPEADLFRIGGIRSGGIIPTLPAQAVTDQAAIPDLIRMIIMLMIRRTGEAGTGGETDKKMKQ